MAMSPAVQPHHREAPTLTSDMTKADLIDVLEHLPLRRGRCLVEIERDVAAYLIRLLRQH